MLLLTISAAPVFAQQAQPRGQNERRAMLEQRLRERTGAIVKQRLALTDAQMSRLQATNKQFESQRTALVTRERDVRRQLRQQILAGDSANQNQVSQLLDQAMQLERQRLDLQQNEQRELAKFMTPVQRAKLFGLQNELRKRAQEMRNRQMENRPRGQLRRGPNFN
jgi:hypothetical protein